LIKAGLDLANKVLGLLSGSSATDEKLDELLKGQAAIAAGEGAIAAQVTALEKELATDTAQLDGDISKGFSVMAVGFEAVMKGLDAVKEEVKELQAAISLDHANEKASDILVEAKAVVDGLEGPGPDLEKIKEGLITSMNKYFEHEAAGEGQPTSYFLQLPRLYQMFWFEYKLCRATNYPPYNWDKRKERYKASVTRAISVGSAKIEPINYLYCANSIALGQNGYNRLTELAAHPDGTSQEVVDRMIKLHEALIRLGDAQTAGSRFVDMLPNMSMRQVD
jgi:hypothetical protein